MAPREIRVGFCGSGVMARALMQGMARAAKQGQGEVKVVAREMVCFDPMKESMDEAATLGAKAVGSNALVAKADCDILILATKPQYIGKVCAEIAESLPIKTVVVSIAAGVTCGAIEEALKSNARVVRVMPNTPCVVGSMAAGCCKGSRASEDDVTLVKDVLAPLGAVVVVPNEDLMNAVTGLSGSGPAYIFLMIEALADGGVRAGLPRAAALELAMHTVKGAAQMCIETKKHPGVLKDEVCSPGGTTIAGVASLEQSGVRSAFIEAVTAAANRSRELSKV